MIVFKHCLFHGILYACVHLADLFNECELDLHNCEQECIDLPTQFVCSCYNGYALQRNGVHCFPYCSEVFTSEVGSFNTPSWPDYYPSDFGCEWIVDLSATLENTSYIIVFRVDASAYGMEEDCNEEYIEFFDGLSVNASSLGRFCGNDPPSPVGTTGLQARIVFHASEDHADNLRGVRVTYSVALLGKSSTTLSVAECLRTVQRYIPTLIPFLLYRRDI